MSAVRSRHRLPAARIIASRFDRPMHQLTRRREKDRHQESWHIYYRDICVGWIGERAGVPKSVDQWGWTCGFYPRDRHVSATAQSFDQARADFDLAWHE